MENLGFIGKFKNIMIKLSYPFKSLQFLGKHIKPLGLVFTKFIMKIVLSNLQVVKGLWTLIGTY